MHGGVSDQGTAGCGDGKARRRVLSRPASMKAMRSRRSRAWPLRSKTAVREVDGIAPPPGRGGGSVGDNGGYCGLPFATG